MSATESPSELMARLRAEREAPRPVRSMPVGITGTREREPTEEEMAAFWRVFDRIGGTELHHGDQEGIDRGCARRVKVKRPAVPVIAHPADWDRYRQPGRKNPAGPIRNEEMMRDVRALIAWPGGVGTNGCVRIAERMGRPVYQIADEVDRHRLDIQADHLAFPSPA